MTEVHTTPGGVQVALSLSKGPLSESDRADIREWLAFVLDSLDRRARASTEGGADA